MPVKLSKHLTQPARPRLVNTCQSSVENPNKDHYTAFCQFYVHVFFCEKKMFRLPESIHCYSSQQVQPMLTHFLAAES